MARLRNRSDYENLRNVRISENEARLASLGLQKTLSDLRSLTSSARATHKKNYVKRVYDFTNLRRSGRLKHISTELPTLAKALPLRRSNRLRAPRYSNEEGNGDEGEGVYISEEEKRPANAPFVNIKDGKFLSFWTEDSAGRCNSKGRGLIYNSVVGICCHFCGQKKLCGKEDCKRCCSLDLDRPCIGKADCSGCHSPSGVFCRACLKFRYGEEIEKVRGEKEWMCPHCIEEKRNKNFLDIQQFIVLKEAKDGSNCDCNIQSYRNGIRISSTPYNGCTSKKSQINVTTKRAL